MISGKSNFDYNQSKDNLIIDIKVPFEEFTERDLKSLNLSQILMISGDLDQNFNHIHTQPLSNVKFDLFHNIIEIHLLLLSNEDLSNAQKLDYAKLQRYFMKKYLNEITKKIYL